MPHIARDCTRALMPPMADTTSDLWISTAQRIQAIAQTGLAYAISPYDVERYSELAAIAASMIAGPDPEKSRSLRGCSPRTAAMPRRKWMYAQRCFRIIACYSFASGKTAVGPFPEDGLRSAKAPPNRSSARSLRSPATSSKRYDCWPAGTVTNTRIHRFPFTPSSSLFHCELLGGSPRTSSETTEVGFFAEEQIPPLSLTRTLPEQIRFVFESLRDPAAPTAFD